MYAACLLYTKSFTNRIHFESFLSAVVLSILRIFSALKLESTALIYVSFGYKTLQIFYLNAITFLAEMGILGNNCFLHFLLLLLKLLVCAPSVNSIDIDYLLMQVLQKQMDLELELFGDLKDKSGSSSVGKVYMLSLSSQPVDHEDASGERQKVSQKTK